MLRRTRLDGELFAQMVRAGQQELRQRREEINSLNVFPVPDGDTGTNMYLSYSAGVEQIHGLLPEATLGKMAQALSSGLLMGARGNSGVILSQLFRGFHLAWQDAVEVDAAQLAQAFVRGAETAYRAVARPVEGTMLTVMRKAAQAAVEGAAKPGVSIEDVLFALWRGAESALLDTPNLLPVLRQAGVVDSGAKGLACILQGFLQGVRDEAGTERDASGADIFVAPDPVAAQAPHAHFEGEYGYCTEFIIHCASSGQDSAVRSAMGQLGDSLIVVGSDDLVKVHLHTGRPGQALERALTYGSLTRIKIDNMTEQHHALTLAKSTNAQTAKGVEFSRPAGLVAVAAGSGLARLFLEAGADQVVSGEGGVNPSTEEIVQVVGSIHAGKVFVLPNHADVIPACEQAVAVLGDSVEVIPTRTVGEGLAAALAFSRTAAQDENARQMQLAASRVVSAAVAPVLRDLTVGGRTVAPGEFIGLSGGETVCAAKDRSDALEQMLLRLCAQARDICTVLCAREDDVREAETVVQRVRAKHADVDFEVLYGGQPVYDFLLAAE